MEASCASPRTPVFELFLTTDNSLAYQQNLKDRKIAIVVLSRNRWRSVQRMIQKIIAAVDAATPAATPSLKYTSQVSPLYSRPAFRYRWAMTKSIECVERLQAVVDGRQK